MSSSDSGPKVSIIVPTLGRVEALDALLHSVEKQSYRHFEVLLIDQNASDLLDALVARHKRNFPIRHLKVCLRGLSRARNYGAQHAKGEVLCFPDDDCELFPDTIAKALELMAQTRSDAVFGRSVDRKGSDAVTPFAERAGRLSLEKHEGMFVDFAIFIKAPVCARFPYDETLGVGVFHGAEEGHDLVLRLLKADVPLFYSPDVLFFHPVKVASHRSNEEIRRVFSYRCGLARLCLKHRLYGKLGSRLVKVCLYLVYLALFDRRRARYYLAELLGLLSGITVP